MSILKPKEIVDYIRSIGDVRMDCELQFVESMEPEACWFVTFGADKLYFKDLETLGVLYNSYHKRYTAENIGGKEIIRYIVKPAPNPLLRYVNSQRD